MTQDSLDGLKEELRQFAFERDWEQFHTANNLAAALSVEVAELQENFLWANLQEVEKTLLEKRENIAEEIGDVLLYLIRLADKAGIDPVIAASNKLKLNALKYPVEKSHGNHKKYTDL